MADYRELLRRAIEALPENTGINRRAVYEKARSALVGQLRAIEPPLPAREITTHRLALEDCIRQVEQEATDRLLGNLREVEAVEETVAAPVVVAEPVEPVVEIPEPSDDDAFDVSEPVAVETIDDEPSFEPYVESEPVATVEVEDAPSEAEDVAVAEPEFEPVEEEPVVVEEAYVPEVEDSVEPVIDEDRFDEPVVIEEAVVEEPEHYEPSPGSIEEIIALAQSSAQAQPEDRDSFVERPDATEVDDAFGDAPAPELSAKPDFDLPLRGPVMTTRFDAQEGEQSKTKLVDIHDQPLGSASQANLNAPEDIIAQAMSSVREVDVENTPRDNAEVSDAQVAIDRAIAALDREARGEGSTSAVDGGDDVRVTADGEAAAAENTAERERGGGFSAVTVFLFVAVLLLGGAGAAGYWAWREGYIDLNTVFAQSDPAPQNVASTNEPVEPSVEEVVPDAPTPTNTTPDVPPVETGVNGTTMPGEELPFTDTETPAAATTEPEVSFEDRLPADAQPQPGSAEQPSDETAVAAAAAGLQSLLLEEQPNGATGAVPYSGSVQWSRGADELGHPTIVGQASIPARNLEMRMVLRRNADTNLPASHLMEINFNVAETFVGGSIASLPGVMLKDEELVQGQPLTGASARIVGNSFLFALSSASERDVETNEALLADRAWLDLAMVYGTGRRAILTLEKGDAGEEIFNDVLDAWAALNASAAAPATGG